MRAFLHVTLVGAVMQKEHYRPDIHIHVMLDRCRRKRNSNNIHYLLQDCCNAKCSIIMHWATNKFIGPATLCNSANLKTKPYRNPLSKICELNTRTDTTAQLRVHFTCLMDR